MTPETARKITAHVRRLLTDRVLNTYDFAVYDVLMWRVRRPGRWDCDPDYATIARLAGICRDRAMKAVAKLAELGVLTKKRRHVLVRWGRNKAQVAARQVSNSYVLAAPIKESSPRAADSGFLESKRGSAALETALVRLGAVLANAAPSPGSAEGAGWGLWAPLANRRL